MERRVATANEELNLQPANAPVRSQSAGPAGVRSGRLDAWSNAEKTFLRQLARENRKADGNVLWKAVDRRWDELAEQHLVQGRTILAMKSQFSALKALDARVNVEAINRPERRDTSPVQADGEGNGPGMAAPRSDATGDVVDLVLPRRRSLSQGSTPSFSSQDSRSERNEGVDRREEVEERSVVEEVEERELERPKGQDLELEFRTKFARVLRAVQNKDPNSRRPIGRLPRMDHKLLVPLANLLVEEKIRGDSSNMRLVGDCVYAAAATAVYISDLRRNGRCQKSKDWYASCRKSEEKIRRELGWIHSELQRRAAGVEKPLTRRQKMIARSFSQRHMQSADKLRARALALKERLFNLKARVATRGNAAALKVLNKTPTRRGVLAEPSVGTAVDPNDVRKYWAEIVGKTKEFKITQVTSEWRDSVRSSFAADPPEDSRLDFPRWLAICRKTASWKASGPDRIHAFWWKRIESANRALMSFCENVVLGRAEVPRWITAGRIVLLPKKQGATNPGDFRPIACINLVAKFLTASFNACIGDRIRRAIPSQQIALRKGVWGVTHAQAVDQALACDARFAKTGKQFHCAWVDFAKAFDSVPHRYLVWLIRTLQIPENISRSLTRLLQSYVVRYELRSEDGKIKQSDPMLVKCGVLQGDVLSPLLFCLSVSPLSYLLSKRYVSCGYALAYGAAGPWTYEQVNHQFYVDDLKLYSGTRKGLTKMLRGLRGLCTKLGFALNPTKCASSSWVAGSTGTTAHAADIPYLGAGDCYKYLGIEQSSAHVAGEIAWGRVSEKALGIAARIFKSKLFLSGKVKAYNTCVIPALKFCFMHNFAGSGKSVRWGTQVKWAKDFDTQVLKLLSHGEVKMRFGTMNAKRVFITRSNLGLGLISCEVAAYEALAYSYAYVAIHPGLDTAYRVLAAAANRSKRTVVKDFEAMVELVNTTGLEDERMPLAFWRRLAQDLQVNGVSYSDPTKAARVIVAAIRNNFQSAFESTWTNMAVAGRVPRDVTLSRRDSSLWLESGQLQTLAVRNVMALQEEQVVGLRGHPGNPSPVKTCRLCKREGVLETAAHAVAACEFYRPTLLKARHDDACRKLYNALCHSYRMKTVHYTEKVPVSQVSDDELIEIWWDRNVNTAVKLKHDRPDVVLIDRGVGRVYIFEVAVTWFDRLKSSTERKYQKYAVNSCLDGGAQLPYPVGDSLAGEVQKLLGLATEVLPVVVGACGEMLPSLRRYLSRVPRLKDGDITTLLERLGRTVAIGTSRVLRAHLANQ